MSVEQDGQRIRECAEQLTLAARSDPAAAERLVEEIDSIAAANPQPIFEAYRQRARGHLLGIRGGMTDAVQRYRQAMALFKECNEEIEMARTASTLVGALVPLGEFEEALCLAKEARRAFQEANLQNRTARLDVNLGNLYHRLNQLEDALLHYERAATFLEHSVDREAAAGVLINRSVVLMLLYRFDDALQGFLRARAFCEEHGLKVLATQAEYNRGYLLFLVGNYAQALKIMQTVEAEFRELGDEIHMAHCRADRAEILLELNLPEHALESANLAEQRFRAAGLRVDRSRTLLLIGRCLMRLNQIDEANVHYSDARRLFEEDGNMIWAFMAELEMSMTLMSSGCLVEAADLAVRASQFFRSQNHVPFSAIADTCAARIFIELHDPDRSLLILNECEHSLKSHLPASVRYDIQYLRGRALELQGRMDEARLCFESAIDALEFLLTHISVDRAMVRFLESKEDVYERLAGLTEDAHQAFKRVDRARSRALSQFQNWHGRHDGASENARRLRESLRSDYLRLFQTGQVQPLHLFEKIQQTEHRLMNEHLKTEFGRAEPPSTQPNAVELDLSFEEVVLEYFVRDQAVSVFVISGGCVRRVTLPISTAELEKEVDLMRYGLSSAGNPRRESALLFHLRRLYDALIAPVEPLLRRRLVIVPHRFLHDLPFHILLGPEGHVAERYVISYAPSLRAYVSASASEPVSSGTSLIIGADVPDLPAVRREIRAVADQLPDCRIAVNKGLEDVRQALEMASFVHVASHALFRPNDPAGSLLHLGNDVLSPADLADLRINADLVTISACSTGRTRSHGNEVPGFVRAFSLWRVPSLIASLWEVNDEATSLLMTGFYGRIRRSPDIAEHLRDAMLEVKEQFAHPSYWGGFVLIGRQQLGGIWNRFTGRKAENSENTAVGSLKLFD